MAPSSAATHAAQPAVSSATPPRGQTIFVREFGRVLRPAVWIRLRRSADLVVLYLASCVAVFADPSIQPAWTNRWLAAIFPLVVIAILLLRRGPDERLNGSLLDLGAYILGVVSLATMLIISVDSLLGGTRPVGLALRLWLFASVYLGMARVVLHSVRRQAVRSEALATPTLIVGAGLIGGHLVKRLVAEPGYGLRPVGFLDSNPLPRALDADRRTVPVLGGLDELDETIRATGARHVILAFSGEPDHVLVSKVRRCQELGVEISLVPRLYETINERTTLDHVGGLPLLSLHVVDPRGWQFLAKHAIDRGLALIGLVLASPLLLAIAAAVRLSSPGPILFRQRRVGRDGREFDLLKFRTMRTEPAEPGSSFELPEGLAPGGVEGADRRTAIGRLLRELSLDELPQLLNVLRGDMSIVGPRPERPEFVARFSRDVARYEDRHRVKSGITGWAQVNGLRGQTSIADRVEWDNYYIQNWSLRLDLRIIALTALELLRFRG